MIGLRLVNRTNPCLNIRGVLSVPFLPDRSPQNDRMTLSVQNDQSSPNRQRLRRRSSLHPPLHRHCLLLSLRPLFFLWPGICLLGPLLLCLLGVWGVMFGHSQSLDRLRLLTTRTRSSSQVRNIVPTLLLQGQMTQCRTKRTKRLLNRPSPHKTKHKKQGGKTLEIIPSKRSLFHQQKSCSRCQLQES